MGSRELTPSVGSCRAHLAVAIVSALVILIAVPFALYRLSNTDPDKLPIDDILYSMEVVRSVANAYGAKSCIVFLGDSRSAFQIEASAFRTDACNSVNLGFPGFGIGNMYEILDGYFGAGPGKPNIVVLTLSLDLFLVGRRERVFNGKAKQYPSTLRERLIALDLTRPIALGQEILSRKLDSVRGYAHLSNGWAYNPGLGRWIYDSLSKRRLLDQPGREQELKEIAFQYYALRTVPSNLQDGIRDLLTEAAMHARKVLVIVPPEAPGLDVFREKRLPGADAAFLKLLFAEAARLGTQVIDCSRGSDCNLQEAMFADPVHLNAEGASTYSAFLQRKISALEAQSQADAR